MLGFIGGGAVQKNAMKWDDMRVFLAVARHTRLMSAGKLLALDPATVGRRITALEEALGAKLFDRGPQGYAMTEAGQGLMVFAQAMENQVTAATEEVGGHAGSLSGTVRIGAPDGFGVGFLAPRLATLAERHPALVAQLVPTPRGFSLSRREADLAVMVGRPEKGRLVARKLTDYTLGLYASPAYLAERPAPVDAAGIAEHRLVGYVEDLIAAPALNYAAEFLRDWRSSVELTSAIGQVEAVKAGAGIGALHDYLAIGPCREGSLVRVLPDLRAMRSYWLAIHENLRDVARVRAAANWLTEAVRREASAFDGEQGRVLDELP